MVLYVLNTENFSMVYFKKLIRNIESNLTLIKHKVLDMRYYSHYLNSIFYPKKVIIRQETDFKIKTELGGIKL